MEVHPEDNKGAKTTFTVLVTGANSGLGFSICCRLIDEFLYTRPQSQSLHLLYSTRDTTKGEDTLRCLNAHLQRTLQEANARTPGVSLLLEKRIKLEGVLVDLTKLLSVKALAKQLLDRDQSLDVVICNAGIAGWTGVNYPKALKEMSQGWIGALTCPNFMHCDVGLLAKPQFLRSPSGEAKGNGVEPQMGQVFTANVFGHYMLLHWLAPLFDAASRLIWISSTSALPSLFSFDDMQCIQAEMAYESSKRLTDLLVLTSELPSTRPWVDTFFSSPSTAGRPTMYVTHPGIIITSIVDLPWYMYIFYVAALFLARWFGSPWHPVDSYKGAVSATFTALAPSTQLPELESVEGKGKWGSATDVWGSERVSRTDVIGWGFCGKVGVKPPGSTPIKGYPSTSKEMRENFEVSGRNAWKAMEDMRIDWERRLEAVDAVESLDL